MLLSSLTWQRLTFAERPTAASSTRLLAPRAPSFFDRVVEVEQQKGLPTSYHSGLLATIPYWVAIGTNRN
jgi:hypothetical protein